MTQTSRLRFHFSRAAWLLLVTLIAAASASAAVKFTTVFDFPGAAAKPGVALVKASDGNFYGATNTEGAYGVGAIYRVTPQGQIATIYSFKGGSDGYSPSSSLVVGPDGNLWGTTSFNNDNTTYGTIYKVTLKGVLTTVHTFTGPDGRYPATELLNGGDGKLYGTLESGFSVGGSYPLYGAIYSITPSGTFKLAYSFKFADAGVAPMAGLIKGKDGFLYGTTSRTSSGFKGGSIFKFDPATSTLTTVYSFKPNTDGSAPGKIVQGKDGNFYGTTTTDGNGGSSGAKAFRVTPSGTFTVLHSFDTAANGYPSGVALVQASDGNFYGTCSNGGKDNYGVVYRLTPGGSFAIVHAFPAVPVGVLTAALEGANPLAPLIDGGDGFLYGTTSNGAGDREAVFRGDGTVFKIALNGTFHLVASFASAPFGKDPESRLISTPEGDLVGTAARGGQKSFGTFFTVSPTGEFKVACHFDPDLNLFHPVHVERGTDGLFYGFNIRCLGCGLADNVYYFYKVSTEGQAQAIRRAGDAEHDDTRGRFALGPDGAFYGMSTTHIVKFTTTGGLTPVYPVQAAGTQDGVVFTAAGKLLATRAGTVFLFDPATAAFTPIYTFKQGEGGGSINSPLVEGSDGNFYGTTKDGGTAQEGSVFKVTPAGGFTVLHSFTGNADGGQPVSNLIQATDGKFYGTTQFGGANQGGTIFSVTASGAITTLHDFDVPGGNPNTPLVQAKDGSFYGVTADGGIVENGTIYRMVVDGVPPQPSPAELLNISTRMEVLTDSNVLIGGFIVSGNDKKKVLVRGLGPSLPVSTPLANPTLELHSSSATLATNDDWKQTQQTAIAATTIPPSNDLESAIVADLPGGNAGYTAILAGKDRTTGIGLVEIYDLAQTANSRLANISTRGFVDTGDNVMIGGLILGPSNAGAAKVLVRGIGPTLASQGVDGALQDPTLELHNENGVTIATNDNWKLSDNGGSQQSEIEATTVPPTDDRESALVRTLTPGKYTAIVKGKNSATGVALVELFNLQ